jgi:peptide/nickel transport system substrate-binding protein
VGNRRLVTAQRQQVRTLCPGGPRPGGLERRYLSTTGRGVFLLATLIAVACGGSNSPSKVRSSEPTVLRVGVPEGNVPGDDLGVGQFVSFLNFESLTLNGPDGRPVPRLAERWQWEDGDRTLRVFLRPSVFLHDNRPFAGQTAADLVREAVTGEGNLARYPSLAEIESVTAPTELELKIRLKRPSGTLPEDLNMQLGAGKAAAGTGPFRTVSRGDETSLEAFDRYYQGKPAIDQVVVRRFESLRTAWAALLRGELDMLYDVPAEGVEFVRNDDVEVISVPRWYQYHLAFNAHHPVLKSPLVRKALNLAVDRAGIVKNVLHGAAEASSGPFYPKYWAYDARQTQYQYNPAAAAALLDAAGYRLPATSGASGPRARFRFTCLIPQNFAVWESVALEIQRDLFNIGVNMQFKSVPFKEFNKLVSTTGGFDAVLGDMISGPTPARTYMWWRSAKRSPVLLNVFGYENAEAERLFETLLRSTNEAATRSAVSKLQRVMYEDPPAIFVAWSTRTRAINKRFTFPGTERDPLVTISQWTLADRRQAAR